ncbi:MAG: ABC transporter permease [Opitutaceae bacterium]
MKPLLRILALIRKELLAILKDPRSLASLIVPPILQCIIFGYAATYDLDRAPCAVLDQDRSATSRALLAELDGSEAFERTANLGKVSGIREAIDARRAVIVLVIGQDFEKHVLSGRPAPVQIIADGRNSNTAGIALGYAREIVAAFNAGHAPPAGAPEVNVIDRAWYNPNLETRWSMIPALIGAITLLQTLLLAAMSVAREREQGTFDQLLVTPFRAHEIMIGKTVPAMLVGLAQAANALLVALFFFQIPFAGSFFTLYAGLMLFIFAAVGIGLFVSSISGTMQQAMMYSFVVMMPFMLLSGLTTPIANMPAVIQYFTLLNPLRYAIAITQRVYLEGTGFARLLPEMGALCLLAAVTLTASAWMFRRKLA